MHAIRLRGPWDCQPLARVTLLADGSLREDRSALPSGGTAVLPDDWAAALGADFRGLVRFTRRFAQPTGLTAATRVWLAIDDVDWQARLALNGHDLGCIQLAGSTPSPLLLAAPSPGLAVVCPARFDITSLLQPRNELVIEVLLPAVEAGAARFSRPRREGQPGGLIGLVRLEIEEATSAPGAGSP